MGQQGGCRCGAIRYEVSGEPRHRSLCHCADCRRSAGATPVAWAGFARAQVLVLSGAPQTYASSPGVLRRFCAACGTGLFYECEAVSPGLIDVQTATFDDAEAFPPTQHVQLADRPAWSAAAHLLPGFARFPSTD